MAQKTTSMAHNDPRREMNSVRRRALDAAAFISCGAAIAALVLTWIGIQVTRDATEESRRIAEESGAFDKPELRLLLGPQELKSGPETMVFLGAPTTTDKALSIGNLPFAITNRGEKTAEDVKVLDQLPEVARPGFNEEVFNFESRAIFSPDKDVYHEIKRFEGYTLVNYKIPSMNPDSAMAFNDPLLLEETDYEDVVQVHTADRKTVDLSVRLRFALRGQVTISAKDQDERVYPLSIEIVQAQGEEELVDKVVKSLSEELTDERNSLSFPASVITPLERTALIAFTEPDTVFENEDAKINFYAFHSDDFRSFTVSNESNIPRYVLTVLSVLAGILLLVAFLRFRRRV